MEKNPRNTHLSQRKLAIESKLVNNILRVINVSRGQLTPFSTHSNYFERQECIDAATQLITSLTHIYNNNNNSPDSESLSQRDAGEGESPATEVLKVRV